MQKLDDYFKLQKEIFKYFGYVEDWRILPLDDARDYYWELEGESFGDSVRFADTREQLEDEAAGNYYSNEIYIRRHLSEWMYRGDEYTLIIVDTHVDGNQLLQVFDNSKEVGCK